MISNHVLASFVTHAVGLGQFFRLVNLRFGSVDVANCRKATNLIHLNGYMNSEALLNFASKLEMQNK